MSTAHHRETTAPLAHVDVVVLDYLAALWAETEDLPPDVRDELMATVADYIAMRRGAGIDPLDDAEQIVRRLGAPEALAAAARRGRLPAHLRAPVVHNAPAVVGPAGHGDFVAVVLLTVGAVVLPVITTLAGLLLVTGSGRWSVAQKAAAWVLSGGTAFAALLCLLLTVLRAEGSELLVLGYLAATSGSFVAGLTLIPGLCTPRRPGTRL